MDQITYETEDRPIKKGDQVSFLLSPAGEFPEYGFGTVSWVKAPWHIAVKVEGQFRHVAFDSLELFPSDEVWEANPDERIRHAEHVAKGENHWFTCPLCDDESLDA